MIIPKEYFDSGRLELGFYYEVTFRRLNKVEKSAGEGKDEKLKSTSSPSEKIGISNLPTKSKEIDWTRIKPAGRRERRST